MELLQEEACVEHDEPPVLQRRGGSGPPRRPRGRQRCPDDAVPDAKAPGGSGNAGDAHLEIRRVEELMAERMERVERQLEELRQEVRKGCLGSERGVTSTYNQDDDDPHRDPDNPSGVTPMRLDWSDKYILEASTWDASLFVFHRCVGPIPSVVVVVAHSVNIILQGWFCVLVLLWLSTPGVTEATLDDLLRFRIAAHSAGFSDELTHESMVRQVCSGQAAGKLHMAGGQAALWKSLTDYDASEFHGGRSFMFLALIIWLCFNAQELSNVYHFFRSLTHVGLGENTRITMTEDADDSVLASVSADIRTALGSAAVAATAAPCRVRCFGRKRYWFAMLLIVLPRMALVLFQTYIGCRFLGKTYTNEDLVLNAMALAFIADIDTVLYAVFVPRRFQALINNTEPLPLPHIDLHMHCSGIVPTCKALVIAGLLGLMYFLNLEEFWWRLDMAEKVLCSGNQDIVWSVNDASGMVYVTRSYYDEGDPWSHQEEAILQVVKPDISNDYWDIDDYYVQLATAVEEPSAVWTPSADSYDESYYSATDFSYMRELHDLGVEEAATLLDCNDLSSGQFVTLDSGEVVDLSLVYLRRVLGDDSILSCDNVSWQTCADFDSISVRSICPERCGCESPPRYFRAYAGFYQGEAAGCPAQCRVYAAAKNEIVYSVSDHSESTSTSGLHACTDIEDAEFIFQGDCVSMDQFALATDSAAKTCRTAACSSDYDDSDFSANDMCCECGGGLRENLGDSFACVGGSLVDECANMNIAAFFYTLYVRGLVDYLANRAEYRDNVERLVRGGFQKYLRIDPAQIDPFIEWMWYGNASLSLADGNWDLMPGLPHPRGLKGCEYLASFEIKALLGFDVCDGSEYGSLRMLCPDTCGCRSSQYIVEVEEGAELRELLLYNSERSDLHHCPAACVLPHPSVTGSQAYDNYDVVITAESETG